ncbi:hypothetical protein [uncultured Muriicola sp.]|uniref:hypothetical protein n=1 Tax=uncultured Muriicola sp. TaxID=1583102 RepID=UPI00345B948A
MGEANEWCVPRPSNQKGLLYQRSHQKGPTCPRLYKRVCGQNGEAHKNKNAGCLEI